MPSIAGLRRGKRGRVNTFSNLFFLAGLSIAVLQPIEAIGSLSRSRRRSGSLLVGRQSCLLINMLHKQPLEKRRWISGRCSIVHPARLLSTLHYTNCSLSYTPLSRRFSPAASFVLFIETISPSQDFQRIRPPINPPHPSARSSPKQQSIDFDTTLTPDLSPELRSWTAFSPHRSDFRLISSNGLDSHIQALSINWSSEISFFRRSPWAKLSKDSHRWAVKFRSLIFHSGKSHPLCSRAWTNFLIFRFPSRSFLIFG